VDAKQIFINIDDCMALGQL